MSLSFYIDFSLVSCNILYLLTCLNVLVFFKELKSEINYFLVIPSQIIACEVIQYKETLSSTHQPTQNPRIEVVNDQKQRLCVCVLLVTTLSFCGQACDLSSAPYLILLTSTSCLNPIELKLDFCILFICYVN